MGAEAHPSHGVNHACAHCVPGFHVTMIDAVKGVLNFRGPWRCFRACGAARLPSEAC